MAALARISHRRPEQGRTALPEQRERHFSRGHRVCSHGRHAATEVPAASAFARSGLRDGEEQVAPRCRNSANAIFRGDTVCVPMAVTRRPKFRQRRRLLVPAYAMVRNKVAQRCRNSANAIFRGDTVCVPMAVTRRPKFRQRRRLLVPAYAMVRNSRTALPEQRERHFSRGHRVCSHGRHAATEVPAASAFARSGLRDGEKQVAQRCRNSANAIFRGDTVCVPMAVTRRPKFRQRRRLLVPAYAMVRNAG